MNEVKTFVLFVTYWFTSSSYASPLYLTQLQQLFSYLHGLAPQLYPSVCGTALHIKISTSIPLLQSSGILSLSKTVLNNLVKKSTAHLLHVSIPPQVCHQDQLLFQSSNFSQLPSAPPYNPLSFLIHQCSSIHPLLFLIFFREHNTEQLYYC